MGVDYSPKQKSSPMGVVEILRRIMGKVVVAETKEEAIPSARSLQFCADHEAGYEAVVHAMDSIFNDENTDAVYCW